MDCTSCAQKIERAVGKVDGVTAANVAFAAQRLTVEFPAGRALPELAERVVVGLGYRLTRRAVGSSPAGDVSPQPDGADEAGHVAAAARALPRSRDPVEALPAEPAARARDPISLAASVFRDRRSAATVAAGILLVAAWSMDLAGLDAASWLYSAAAAIAVVPIAHKAWRAARLGSPFSIELLVTIAAAGAVAIDALAEAALVAFLFNIGEMLEGVAAAKARSSIRALADLVPSTALLVEGADVREVAAASLAPGDVIEVRPGGRIPADGAVIAGAAAVDMSPVTGESVPVTVDVGQNVLAGTVSTDGALRIRVERPASDNTIARIIRLVEEAESARAPTARFIDRFSRWYTPAVILLSAIVTVAPPLLLAADWSTWIYRGLAMLLIACPCALVISVPASITAALASGARRGLLFKGGAALEAIGKVRSVAFDKTGTLTTGKPTVARVEAIGTDVERMLSVAAAVESGSDHPLATAIRNAAAERGVNAVAATDHRAIPGMAATAVIAGETAAVGSPRYLLQLGLVDALARTHLDRARAQGQTIVGVTLGAELLGVIAFADELRPDARAAVSDLKALGLRPVILTGDSTAAAARIADALRIEARAELLPAAKLDHVASMRSSGGVAMVGDGINDAPALARADVGIAMGRGTDIALETADAALLRDRLTGVAEMVRLSRAALANVRQNVALAIGLKGAFLLTTAFGVTGLWLAILADTGATVIVTLNALRLLRFSAKQ
ncbi:MAG: cadmium-translocating P-type ATPase [Alphaproteobacteria bacterium]|nr:cadmium-translocating P-type ATPase [Alphaproteobacteria bacterium]